MSIYDIISDIIDATDCDRSEALEIIRLSENDNDFEFNNYRFIAVDDIDDIQQEELSGDLYVLGCFNSWFLASVLDISESAIRSFQEAEAFEGIGELIISGGHLAELQSKYAAADGYGHHFAHYDHETHEIGDAWLAFRVN